MPKVKFVRSLSAFLGNIDYAFSINYGINCVTKATLQNKTLRSKVK